MMNKELISHIELVSRISAQVKVVGAPISQYMVFPEPLNELAKL